MNFSAQVLKNDEKAIYALRELYKSYGYERYKVSKFEEYDLYAHNKSFLVSENILSFTDTNGKLMALKPDITLSIVKNVAEENLSLKKLCYNETVYRTSSNSNGFQEIMQTGLECIGNIDLYSIGEVVMLAQKSLAMIDEKYLLDLSHMGFLTGFLEEIGILDSDNQELLGYIANKNASAIRAFCKNREIASDRIDCLLALSDLYEPLDSALPKLLPFVSGDKMQSAYNELVSVCKMIHVCGDPRKLYLDFSMINDMNYYNGIVFRGYINGIPDGILSGGRYDRLLNKMGKQSGAIGFAVYHNFLERLNNDRADYDVDAVLLYDKNTDVCSLMQAAESLRQDGMTVKTVCGTTTSIRCRELLQMTERGVKTIEKYD